MAIGRTGMSVSFLRLTRSTILCGFQNLTLAQVEELVNVVKAEYPSLIDDNLYPDEPHYHNFTIQNMYAASISDGTKQGSEGYYILQIDKRGTPVPWGITEYIKTLVNQLQYTGSLPEINEE